MTPQRLKAEWWLMRAVGGALGAFLILPLLALFATMTLPELLWGLQFSLVWPALRLSLCTSLVSILLVVLFGTPLAWVLARSKSRVCQLLELVLQLPIVIPPAVAGVALLLAFGRHGMLSGLLYPSTWRLAFSSTAVVMAEVFVAAPFYIQATVNAFRRIDERLVTVARSFGASPARVFFHVALPLSVPGIVAGAAMSWARALGEFGATLMFAGNVESRTQTLPLAIYTALELDLRAAQAISILLVAVAFSLLLSVRVVLPRSPQTLEYTRS